MQYDVIVVGGGTSGLMAAIHSAQQGASTILVEKNRVLGRKILLTGGGRCNVTNRTTVQGLVDHIPGNGKFLYSALSQFNQEDIVHFFESRGVKLKEEDHGRMFPVTNKARTILDALLEEAKNVGVTIQTKAVVEGLVFSDDKQSVTGIKVKDQPPIYGKSVILAVGGRAYPGAGSTGDGYGFAKSAGHTIQRLYPTEAPILSNDSFIKDRSLQGVSLRDVLITLYDKNNKVITQHQMDMIFTHKGYSGPAILRTSGHLNQYLHRSKEPFAHLSIDLTPQETIKSLNEDAHNKRDKELLTLLKQWMPERLALVILNQVRLKPDQPYRQLTPPQEEMLWQQVKSFNITGYGTEPIEKGFVTGGGVTTDEVEPKTMESKLVEGLYFCGELLDINGYTGGYNITAAFVTGAIAGQYASWDSFGR